MKRLLPIIVLLTSCGFNDDLEYKIDPDITPFVDSFFNEASKRDIIIPKENLVVFFSDDVEDGVGGVSSKYGDQRMIRINKKYKDTRLMKHIVFHELGHSVLYREHTSSPSIMNPGLSDPNTSDTFIDELFDHSVFGK